MRKRGVIAVFSAWAAVALASAARATPSTTFWAPSTTYIQPYLVPHLTYDTYFWKGPWAGMVGAPLYPIDTGVTIGVLPFEELQLEVGYDLFLPTADPLGFFLNAKVGTPEGTLFARSPSLAIGVFGVGITGKSESNSGTNYDIVYGQAQKTLPWGGYISAGGYGAAGAKELWTGSDGKVHRAGFIGAVVSPDLVLDLPGLKKLNAFYDVQTGNNIFGATGVGVGIFFSDTIDILTGAIYFFDGALQPGRSSWMWTVQLDVDIPLRQKAIAAAPSPAGP